MPQPAETLIELDLDESATTALVYASEVQAITTDRYYSGYIITLWLRGGGRIELPMMGVDASVCQERLGKIRAQIDAARAAHESQGT